MVSTPAPGAFLDTEIITAKLAITPGMHVADLGTGSGYFTISLARAVGKEGVVSAVDVRQEPLDEVRAKSEVLGLGNIRPIRADLEVLGGTGIPDNSQDLSLLASVLFQSSKRDAMIAEAARMLKSGGRLVVIDWKKGVDGFGPPDNFRSTEDEVKSMAEGKGLKFHAPVDAGRFYFGLVFMKP
jgi:ubiquinone/menaquinone biosynthesis C-methylase UbiE